VVVATPDKGPDDAGPTITLPPELESDVEVSGYRQDGYVGSVLRFSDLTFDQVGQLNQAVGPVGNAVRFQMRRGGNRIVVSGAVDLTRVTVDNADFQLKISFPGDVLESNGEADSGTVSWNFTAGEVGDFSAVAASDDPNAPSPLNWTILMATLVGLGVVGTVWYARRSRNPPISPRAR
jgi:hypothetical protein